MTTAAVQLIAVGGLQTALTAHGWGSTQRATTFRLTTHRPATP
ncbi:hypothetical protein [Natrinema saccharevitans]|nr:hypothetical protein [Natrinema saccharevitans]